MTVNEQPVTIKRYGGCRLYNTRSARYVSFANLTEMPADEAFVVRDAKSGANITRSVRNAIIYRTCGS